MTRSSSSRQEASVGERVRGRGNFDLSAGVGRDLATGVVFGPGAPDLQEANWYDRRNLRWVRSETRVRGRGARRRLETETREIHLTAGVLVGGAAVLALWEIGQSIAHALQGADPLTWASDVSNWLDGTADAPPSVSGSVLGFIDAHVAGILSSAPSSSPAPSSSSGSSSYVGGTPVPFPLPPFELPPI